LPSFLRSTEPKPGQPLNAESERILRGIPESISDAPAESDAPDALPISSAQPGAEAIAGLMPEIVFDAEEVQAVLEEAFDWLAQKFDSAHWKLTDRQSRMLGRPTAQLLGSLYAKIGTFLPGVLARWCESTPGAMGFLLASGIVIGPKIATQFQVSRARRQKEAQRVGPRAVPAQPIQRPMGPVGRSPVRPAAPIDEAAPESEVV